MRVIHLTRKPLSEASVAANVLKHGTGGINIDAGRVASPGEAIQTHSRSPEASKKVNRPIFGEYGPLVTHQTSGQKKGRWPNNVVLQHHDGCSRVGTRKVRATSIHGAASTTRNSGNYEDAGGYFSAGQDVAVTGYADEDGMETVEAWVCAPGCPVADLDGQSGDRPVSGAAKAGRPATGGGTGQATVAFGIEEGNGTLHADKGGASRYYKQVCDE